LRSETNPVAETVILSSENTGFEVLTAVTAMYRRLVWHKDTDVSDDHASSIFSQNIVKTAGSPETLVTIYSPQEV
jgi:hypothetical protein